MGTVKHRPSRFLFELLFPQGCLSDLTAERLRIVGATLLRVRGNFLKGFRRQRPVEMPNDKLLEACVNGCHLLQAIKRLPVIRQELADGIADAFGYASVIAIREFRVEVVNE